MASDLLYFKLMAHALQGSVYAVIGEDAAELAKEN
jgi:hypothetical protein